MENKIIYWMYLDENDNPIERTPLTHPYSYDGYVLWKNNKKANDTVYSDRLMQWDHDKFNKCCMEVWGNQGQYFDSRTHEEIERFLNLYLGCKLEIVRIMQYCNVSNGYPLWRFDYIKN